MYFIRVSYLCWGVTIFNITRYNFIIISLILQNLLAFILSHSSLNVAICWNSLSQRVPLLLYKCESLAWILIRLQQYLLIQPIGNSVSFPSLWGTIRITLSFPWPCSLGILESGAGFLKEELNWIQSKNKYWSSCKI